MLTLEEILQSSIAKGKVYYERLMEECKNPLEVSTATLMAQLRKSENTDYGRKYNFKDIKTVEDYKVNVPFSTHDNYKDYIQEFLNGDENAKLGFYDGKLVCMALSSGSTGEYKKIPVSMEEIKKTADINNLHKYLQYETHPHKPIKRARGVSTIVNQFIQRYPNGLRGGAVSGFMLEAVGRDYCRATFTTPSESIFYESIKIDNSYIRIRYGLMERDISVISATFSPVLFYMIIYLLNNREIILNDIELGTIDESIKMPADLREELLKELRPDPERAKELRDIFESCTDDNYDGIMSRVWPNLRVILTIGSATFKPFTEKLLRFFDEKVCFDYFLYGASEGIFATTTTLDDEKCVLIPSASFLEFIPIENVDDDKPETLLINEIEIGKEYEIVITNLSGFFRYRIGDVVRVEGKVHDTPQIVFSYRLKQLANMCGEKTNEKHMRAAIRELEKWLGVPVYEYALYPDTSVTPMRYVFLLEVRNPVNRSPEEIGEYLHEQLRLANNDIAYCEDDGEMGRTKVNLVQPETFMLYDEMRIYRGTPSNQIKPVRIIDTEEKKKFFFGLLQK